MAEVVFFIAALGAIGGAADTAALLQPLLFRPYHAGHPPDLAACLPALRAGVLAGARVVVYARAVMVLYVFVSAYIGNEEAPVAQPPGPGLRGLSVLFAVALLVELCIAILGTGLTAIGEEGRGFFAEFGSPGEIGKLL